MTVPSALPRDDEPAGDAGNRVRVYVASKSCHAPMWHDYRSAWECLDVDVVSTWIDEAGPGESNLTDLWRRCVDEAASADLLVAMHLADEEWKGAFVEIGAALAAGKPVYVVGRPPGSWLNHHLVTIAASPDGALNDYLSALELRQEASA